MSLHPDGTRPEFSRTVDVRHLPAAALAVEADEAERRALAGRFGLVSIGALRAVIAFGQDGEAVSADGRLTAQVVQPCAISGEDLAVSIDEPLALRFVPEGAAPQPQRPDEEIELDADALDEIPYSGTAFDLGEAIAQSLALAIDPYATGPEAERVRAEYGLDDPGAGGAFAALAALKAPKKDD